MTMNISRPIPRVTSDFNKTKPNPLKSNSVNKWLKALGLFDTNKPEEAIELFNQITPTNSKILYNIASIYAILGDYSMAISHFKKATTYDSYMAISHFQIGVSRFLSGSYAKAATSFNTALKLLRGNSVVNYQQLGLDYKLYSCEIVYNRALSYIYSGELATGIFDLGFAAKEKKYIPEHDIIDESLAHFIELTDLQQQVPETENDNLLKLPGSLDTLNQRFSVVDPPKKLPMFSPTQSIPSVSAQMFEKAAPASGPKEISYSLFSVPQGSLFRLTEIKVRSILNNKSLGEMMYFGASKTPISNTSPSNSFDSAHSKQQSTSKISFLHSSLPQALVNNTIAARHEEVMKSQDKVATTHSIPTPPISPDLLLPSNNLNSNQPFNSHMNKYDKTTNDDSYSAVVENTQKLVVNTNCSKPVSTNLSQPNLTNSMPPQQKSYSENFGRSASLGSPLNGGRNNIGTTRAKSHSTSSPYLANGHTVRKPSTSHIPGNYSSLGLFVKTNDIGSNPQENIDTSANEKKNDIQSSNMYRNGSNGSLVSPKASSAVVNDTLVKVKIFCGNETRAIRILPGISFYDLRARIAVKIQSKSISKDSHVLAAVSNNLILRIKDEDDDLVLIGDQEDLDGAIGEAFAQNRENPKLSVYVENAIEAEI